MRVCAHLRIHYNLYDVAVYYLFVTLMGSNKIILLLCLVIVIVIMIERKLSNSNILHCGIIDPMSDTNKPKYHISRQLPAFHITYDDILPSNRP